MGKYWKRATKAYKRQREKGIMEYGQTLEENTTLTDPLQILDEVEQELVDAIMYTEHAKEKLKQMLKEVEI